MDIQETLRCMRANEQLPFPWLLQLELTNGCPFHCPLCYKKDAAVHQMNFHKAIELVAECSRKGTGLVVLNGGEPLLYDHFAELLRELKKYPVSVNCFTSGYGMTGEIISEWDFEKNKFCFSLNGSTDEINSLTRVGYHVTLNAMKVLKEKKKRYGVNWVAGRENLPDFEKMLELCERMGVSFLFVTCEKETGKGNFPGALSPQELDALSRIINGYHGEIQIYVENCFAELQKRTAGYERNPYYSGCFAGKYGCHVDVYGNFSPCTHIADTESWACMDEYWKKSEKLRLLNDRRREGCCVMPCRISL